MNTPQKLFYFSRNREPHPLATKHLVSGVIEAASLEDAKAKLTKAMAGNTIVETANDFKWSDLQTVERSEHGILAITMGES